MVYWSQADGYKFDFDLDGTVDFSLPTQTTDKAISQVFVFDANGDGYFDLCELDLNDNLINWIFYYNDGNNNFVDPQTVIYGMSEGDKKLAGDFNGDGIGDVGIRRDNEFGLWWLITFQAMAPDVNQQFGISDKDLLVIHNLNSMHSRAGAQTPFSSINYGMDTSPEGRMVMKNIMLATEAGLGGGETPIFPIQIFRVKEGVNYNPGEPNYDLFQLAIRCSARRLFPNFSFLDAPFNLAYYKPGHYETEVGYMGCRTRVMGNVCDPDNQIAPRRGNLSFTTINLPRIAILANGNIEWFFDELDRKIDLCVEQLLERFAIQCKKKVCNYPFLMGEGCWLGSENLGWNDEVGEVLKNGTLSVGFIGLAECLKALIGQHHGESQRAQNLGLEIISHMRKRMDDISQARKLNVTLLATPAEGLSGRFVKLDRKRFGALPGITDREYYTNSFHVPVYFPIGAFDKIRLEAPYHALTNAGHISYVELDGEAQKNVRAIAKIVKVMHDEGIGYGSINHPVDRDGVCGYNGIIGDTCPRCGRAEHEGPHFQRIRRITGYLVGTMDKWNDAKRAEEAQRVKHSL